MGLDDSTAPYRPHSLRRPQRSRERDVIASQDVVDRLRGMEFGAQFFGGVGTLFFGGVGTLPLLVGQPSTLRRQVVLKAAFDKFVRRIPFRDIERLDELPKANLKVVWIREVQRQQRPERGGISSLLRSSKNTGMIGRSWLSKSPRCRPKTSA